MDRVADGLVVTAQGLRNRSGVLSLGTGEEHLAAPDGKTVD
jgi:hypothetical protein